MTWDLRSSKVDLKGYLNVKHFIKVSSFTSFHLTVVQFPPDIQFWLNANNTYRVVFIQVTIFIWVYMPASDAIGRIKRLGSW